VINVNFDRLPIKITINIVIISDSAHDNFVIKPIVGGLAHFRNWFSQLSNLLGIGLELVFFGKNCFFLIPIGSMFKGYKILISKTIFIFKIKNG